MRSPGFEEIVAELQRLQARLTPDGELPDSPTHLSTATTAGGGEATAATAAADAGLLLLGPELMVSAVSVAYRV